MPNQSNSAVPEICEFTSDELGKVDDIIHGYKSKPGSLIPVLEEVQETIGYLPISIQKRIAAGLNVAFGEIYGVVTFYSFFTMVPKGKHTIRCCLGTACYVRGGKKLLDAVSRELEIGPGDTTEDRRFSLETVRCLGACGLAPVAVVDNKVVGRLVPEKMVQILKET